MTTYTDAALVEALIRNAIGPGSTPALDDEQVESLVGIAMPDGAGDSETLQRAAVVAWTWKAGMTADQYTLKAASGASLNREQWHAHCVGMANGYAKGIYSVDGSTIGIDLTVVDNAFGVITFSQNFLTGECAS